MFQRLNYYSRYNRIKNQKDIPSLFHLILDHKSDPTSFIHDIHFKNSCILSQQHSKSVCSHQLNDTQPQNYTNCPPVSANQSKNVESGNCWNNQGEDNNLIIGSKCSQGKAIENKNKANITKKTNFCGKQHIAFSNTKSEQNKEYSPIRQILSNNKQDNDQHKQDMKLLQKICKLSQQSTKNPNPKSPQLKTHSLDDKSNNEQQINNTSFINKLTQQYQDQDQDLFSRQKQIYGQSSYNTSKYQQYQDKNQRQMGTKKQISKLRIFGKEYNFQKDGIKYRNLNSCEFNNDNQQNHRNKDQLTKNNQRQKGTFKISINTSKQVQKIPKRRLIQGLSTNYAPEQLPSVISSTSNSSPINSPTFNPLLFKPPTNSQNKNPKANKSTIVTQQNQRIVTSTLIQESPIKKLNFKKLLKKQSPELFKNHQLLFPSQNKFQKHLYQQNLYNQSLLQAFFKSNK